MGSSHSLAHRGAILPFCWFFFLRGWITFFKFNISLTSIDLSGLIHVTQIQYSFLGGCSSLCNLDLTPLSRVTGVGHSFLKGCSSLCELDLSPLRSVTAIDSYGFLWECTSLGSIYLTGCSDVVSTRVRTILMRLVVESRPKRSRDEPLEESRKRLRHAE